LIGPAQQAIAKLMRQRRHLRATDADDFDVTSVREQAAMARAITRTMPWLIAAVAGISLLVGGIGIMNIMLVSVKERTPEIGLRMAVGAKSRDVLVQFLVEALVLSLVGGIAGVLLGIGAAFCLSWVGNWPFVVSPTVVLVDCAVAAAIGIFFGLFPAWKASRLNPIDALRYE
jgi:ABC-type antimicrobial peptide transport system permease subunit